MSAINRVLTNFDFPEKSCLAKFYDKWILGPSVFSLFGGHKVSVLTEEAKRQKVETYRFKKTAIAVFALALPLIGACLLLKCISREERRFAQLFKKAHLKVYSEPTVSSVRKVAMERLPSAEPLSRSTEMERKSSQDKRSIVSIVIEPSTVEDKWLEARETEHKVTEDPRLIVPTRSDNRASMKTLRDLVEGKEGAFISRGVRQESSEIPLSSGSNPKSSSDSLSKSSSDSVVIIPSGSTPSSDDAIRKLSSNDLGESSFFPIGN